VIVERNWNKKQRVIAFCGFLITLFWLLLFFPRVYLTNDIVNETTVGEFALEQKVAENSNGTEIKKRVVNNFLYLSDLEYLTTDGMSQNGWGGHAIQKDKNQEGGELSLIVDGEKRPFAKGLSIHARGWATYDISSLSTDYPRFIAQLGVDASRGTNGSIFYRIYASYDATIWDTLFTTEVLTGISEAVDVDVTIEGYKYLRIYVDPNGSNAADHGTIANAKLVTSDYIPTEEYYDKLHKVEYYDEILNAYEADYNYENNYRLILERALVSKIGYWNIQVQSEVKPNVVATLDWILSNNRVLEEVIEVGEISNGSKFLNVLSDLYNNYIEELKTENGYVYEKMMIGLAAAYSTDTVISPLSFSFLAPTYDYMERFAIMKRLFDNNELKITGTTAMDGPLVTNEWFKDYHVELMRMVMQDGTTNIELGWLNGYTHLRSSLSFYLVDKYMSPNYGLDRYYAEENRATYDAKYHLSEYGVPYGLENGRKISKYWMVVEHGGICWNGSRFGQSLNRVNGVPATGGYQPGHELYIHYYQDANGNGTWLPRYGNWGSAGSTWGGANPYRYLFNWNNKYFTDKHISGSKGATSTGYLYLAQANLNRYEEFKKSFYYNLIANSYTSNELKVSSYKKALEVNNMNLDSYDGIITAYKAMNVDNGGTITPHDWFELANDIIDAYTYYPVAMFDLLKVIRPYLEGSERLYIDRLEKEALTRATIASASDTVTTDGTRTHARQLLNAAQPDPMTFSFDGENGGKIIKNPSYQFVWGYSLDGGQTYKSAGTADSITLTSEEIASITAENDIKFNFQGIDYIFTIDIIPGVLSTTLYPNDLENRVVGIDLTYEWRNSESDDWISYRTASPDNTGNKTLYVRRGATGRSLPSDSVIYSFTEDNQPNTRKYVSVSHLSIHAVSSQATSNGGAATNAIDGNYNTRYHSDWNGGDTQRFIIIKLDKPRYVSAVEFVPAGGGNGKIIDGTILGSSDGENWEILSQRTGISYSNQANTNEQAKQLTQSFEIANPKEVQYIKIVADRATNGNWFSARAFNIFQDLSLSERPTAGIGYSTTDPTQENVVARLINVSSANYEITSPGGDTHVFTEEGEHSFTFTFIDKETGLEGSAVAKVDWIDRTAPTATFEYNPKSPTNSSVYATLKPNEEVIVLNNGYFYIDSFGTVLDVNGNVLDYTVDENGIVRDSVGKVIDPLKYEFINNGEFTFEFIDRAGNKGTATAKVDWIDFDAPEATLSYDKTTTTSNPVTVTIDFSEEAIVTNNNGNRNYTFTENGEFTFEYRDLAGNTGTITAKVDWIEKKTPSIPEEPDKPDKPDTGDNTGSNNNDNNNNNNNGSNNNSSNDKWTSSTNTTKPSTGINTKVPSPGVSTDQNENINNGENINTTTGDKQEINDNKTDKEQSTNKNESTKQDVVKEEQNTKNEKNRKWKYGIIGLFCFAVLSLTLIIKRRHELRRWES